MSTNQSSTNNILKTNEDTNSPSDFQRTHSIDITAEPIGKEDQLITFSIIGEVIGFISVSNETYMDPDAMVNHLTKLFNKKGAHQCLK